MKYGKRILSLCLALLMVLQLAPLVGAQEQTVTVYLDQVNGDNTNSGLSESSPVKTFDGAYMILQQTITDPDTTDGKIVLVNDYLFEFTSSSVRKDIASSTYAHTYDLTICGKTPDVSLTFKLASQSYLGVIGPTTFENLNMRLADDSASPYLTIHGRGGGHYLKIGQGVTGGSTESKKISLSAAPYFKTTQTKPAVLEVNSGDWRNVFGSGYGANVTVNADASLTINGGSIMKAAIVYKGTHNGDVTITVNGGTVGLLETASLNAGTVTGNVTTTITGGTITDGITCTNLTGENNVILAPSKGVTLGGSTTVSQLTGGTVTMQPSGSLTVTDAVTGTTNVSVDGTLCYGNYLTVPSATADSAIVFTQEGITQELVDGNKVWSCKDTSAMCGLALQVKEDVTLKLYTGFSNGNQVTPTRTYTENGVTTYFFVDVSGKYRYVASGTGYYTITKYIYVSPEEAQTLTTMDVTPGTTTGAGWEASSVIQHTDELLANRPDDASLWPDYQEAFQTPFFINNHPDHQFTTHQEMMDYLNQLADNDPHMYIYSAGNSGLGQNIPLVIFTTADLSKAETIEQAAALLRANGKMTVHYQGQMHGTEPAGGEGALAMVKKLSGSYGDKVLQNLNIYVIPRLNADGAKNNNRKVTAANLDMNRDYLLMKAIETKNVQYVAQIFQPDMMIDSHEYNVGSGLTTDIFVDLQISPGFHTFNTGDFRDTSLAMTQNVFGAMTEQNLSATYYSSQVNSKSNYIGRNYATAKGTLFFLLETRGIDFGSTIFGRRVVSHLVATTELIDYAYENHEQLKKLVADERQHIIDLGTTYDEDNLIALQTGTTKHPEFNVQLTRYYTDTGKAYAYTHVISECDVLTRSRVAATAYVIPAGESWTEPILELMDRHGITYTSITPGSVISLQQYTGTTTAASLLAEQEVTFEQGAYVFTMNQVGGRILANLMEPDVTDISEHNSTLVMAGMIPELGEGYALYRYAHDLNEDGFVDYIAAPAAPEGLTVKNIPAVDQSGAINGLDGTKLYEYSYNDGAYVQLPAGTTSITVTRPGVYYVRLRATESQLASAAVKLEVGYDQLSEYVVYLSTSGNDENNGFTAANAVATIDTAYSRLEVLLTGAAAGTEGKIVVDGVFNLGTNTYDFPAHTFPVTIVGQDTTDGFTHKGGGSDVTTVVNFNGPTTLDNLTWKLTSTIVYNYIGANGHKLVIGEGFTSVLNSKGTFYNLCGGSYSGEFDSTELVVKGGTWRNIYYGTYKGTVKGDAMLTMTGGTYTSYLQSNYSGAVNGNATAELSNCAVGSLLVGGNKSAGTVMGNVTLTLGEGITGTATISSVAGTATLGGTFTVILDGADTTGMPMTGDGYGRLILKDGTIGAFEDFEKVTLATTGLVKLGADITSDMTVEGNSYLDLNGHVLTGDLTGSGTLYGLDSATNDYTSENAGRITGTVKNVVKHFKNTDGKRYLAVADENGYSFHRFYLGITHANLKPSAKGVGYKAVFAGSDVVKAHVDGVGYSLQLEGNDPVTRQLETFTSMTPVTLRVENYDAENWGTKGLTAQVYMVIDGETVYSTACTYSLQQLVETVNEKFASYSEDQLAAIAAWIAQSEAMKSWKTENLCKA